MKPAHPVTGRGAGLAKSTNQRWTQLGGLANGVTKDPKQRITQEVAVRPVNRRQQERGAMPAPGAGDGFVGRPPHPFDVVARNRHRSHPEAASPPQQ